MMMMIIALTKLDGWSELPDSINRLVMSSPRTYTIVPTVFFKFPFRQTSTQLIGARNRWSKVSHTVMALFLAIQQHVNKWILISLKINFLKNYPLSKHTHTHTHTHTYIYIYIYIWTPAYGQAKAGRQARTYIQQLCEDTGCSPEDLPEAMNDREKWRERVKDIRASGMTWWWWYNI